jgi:hypothetical protein
MVGAIQFIKGDSIAGLVVSAINIAGGLVVGIGMNGMSAADAVQTYTLLTVGAGLVSQIPGMIGAVSAGILISRVTPEGEQTGLGGQAAGQIQGLPMAMMLAAGMLVLLGVVPGMPLVPFWAMGAGLGWYGYSLSRPKAAAAVHRVAPFGLPGALSLQLPGKYRDPLLKGDLEKITGAVESEVARISLRIWGAPFPRCSVVPGPEGETLAALFSYGVKVKEMSDGPGATFQMLSAEVCYNPARYFGDAEASRWVQKATEHDPLLVQKILSTVLPPQEKVPLKEIPRDWQVAAVGRILRELLRERVPIFDSRAILNAIWDTTWTVGSFPMKETAVLRAVDMARLALREGTAQLYRERFNVAGYRALGERLEKSLLDPSAANPIMVEIRKHCARNAATLLVASNAAMRRLAWSFVEKHLYESGSVPHPILVLSIEENALRVPFPSLGGAVEI